MKDFEQHPGQDDRTTSADHRQVRKQKVLTGRIIPRPGQKVWEYDLATDEIKPAEILSSTAVVADARFRDKLNPAPAVTIRKTAVKRDNCLYIASLNKTNAEKKFKAEIARMVAAGILTGQ